MSQAIPFSYPLLLVTILISVIGFSQDFDSDEQEEISDSAVVRDIRKLVPKLSEILKELKTDDEREYEEVLEHAREIVETYRELRTALGVGAAKVYIELQVLDHDLGDFEEAYHDAKSEKQMEEVLERFEIHCTKMFELETSLMEAQLELLDDGTEEFEELEEEIADRERNDQRYIRQMYLEFLEEAGIELEEEEETPEKGKTTNANMLAHRPIQISAEELVKFGKMNFDTDILPKLKTACFDCHYGSDSDGNLDFEKLLEQKPLVVNMRRWQNVIAQIENRSMPPADADQPPEMDRRLLAGWFKNSIENFDYGSVKNPGYEPTRRLTHLEYNNTIRDLFGIDSRPADRLPEDLSGTSGFDNSVNSLFLHGSLLEKYLGLAEFVLESSIPKTNRNSNQNVAFDKIFLLNPTRKQNTPQSFESLDRGEAKEYANRILTRFVMLAFRGQASPTDFQNAVNRYVRVRDSGADFEDAIRSTLQTILISPKFLFHFEKSNDESSSFEISDIDLANRLSYFLWASMPDKELFQLANEKKLSDPKVLQTQVLRMLQDSKSETLGTKFAAQWLGFQHLGTRIRADPIDNPWCTDSLMDAMKMESAMFFVSLIRENRSLKELIDSDYTFVNQELAKFYRLPKIEGAQLRRVSISTKQRGGIFGQASILAVTSFPYRTSPVVRGKWILEDVLGTPPPPPPPNVSELDEEIAEKRGLSRREKLEMHRNNPNCYACHSQIDPLGFSLENYDWFGRFQRRKSSDVSGQLPNGTQFEGPSGLKRVIIEQRMDDLLKQVTRKLLAYSLGRQLEYYDEATVRKICEVAKKDGYKMQTIVIEITNSYPFRNKQVQNKRVSQ